MQRHDLIVSERYKRTNNKLQERCGTKQWGDIGQHNKCHPRKSQSHTYAYTHNPYRGTKRLDQERWELEADGFAGPRGHHHKRVTSAEGLTNYVVLHWTKCSVTKPFLGTNHTKTSTPHDTGRGDQNGLQMEGRQTKDSVCVRHQ
jgi:hypothetical protein